MTEERNEVYERIPWETLEKKGGDRQWLLMAFAVAVVVGALAFSFMQSQPSVTQPQPTAAVPEPVGMTALVMFLVVIGVMLAGFPVAFTLAGTALAFALAGTVAGIRVFTRGTAG